MDVDVNALIASTLGAEVIAVVLETFIFGIVTFQYGTYLMSGFKDPYWIVFPMAALYLMNTFHLSSIIYLLWHGAIANFGNMAMFAQPKIWPFSTSSIFTSVSALVAQQFLIYRAYRLAYRSPYRLAMVLPVSALSLAACAVGISTAVKVFQLPSVEQLASLNPVLTAWFTLEAAVDVLTAGILLYSLWESKTTFKKTGRIIQRLFRTAVQTGIIMSIFAGLVMALFLAYPNTEYVAIPGMPIGCVYCATLLDTLLSRKELRAMIEGVETSQAPGHSQNISRSLAAGPGGVNVSSQQQTWSFQQHSIPLDDINVEYGEKKGTLRPSTSH